MSEELVNIEVDGVPVKARRGAMIIQATDAHGAYVPRFCYHEKLSIAANCRMCLVEVEKAPKPLPACATPVTEGMKVMTQSPVAKAAQNGVMEFLLINRITSYNVCYTKLLRETDAQVAHTVREVARVKEMALDKACQALDVTTVTLYGSW